MDHVTDEKDRLLLDHLQNNARMTSSELSNLINLSPSGVQKRLRKLEENGIIDKYATVINRKSLGYGLTVFVQVTLQGHTREAVAEFDEIMQQTQEVMECHRVTGTADYLLKTIVRDHEHLDQFLMNYLLPIPSVERVNSNLVLKAVKETTNIDVMSIN